MALRSAMEAHSVHRNMGHLLGGDLHLEEQKRHNSQSEFREKEETAQQDAFTNNTSTVHG